MRSQRGGDKVQKYGEILTCACLHNGTATAWCLTATYVIMSGMSDIYVQHHMKTTGL